MKLILPYKCIECNDTITQVILCAECLDIVSPYCLDCHMELAHGIGKVAHFKIGGGTPNYVIDPDADGSWANVVKASEE